MKQLSRLNTAIVGICQRLCFTAAVLLVTLFIGKAHCLTTNELLLVLGVALLTHAAVFPDQWIPLTGLIGQASPTEVGFTYRWKKYESRGR